MSQTGGNNTLANVKIRTHIFPLVLSALTLGALPSAVCHAEGASAVYSDSEAEKHKGEDASVTGKVFGVSKSAKGTTFINFGARYPNHTFTGVVFAGDAQKVGDLSALADQTVTLTGRIELSNDGKPQIIIKSLDQIVIPKTTATTSPTQPPVSPVPSTQVPTSPAPSTPATPPVPTPPTITSNPTLSPQPTPPPKASESKRIALSPNWTTAQQTGEMTRKDLATIFGDQISTSKNTIADESIVIYPDVPYLTPLVTTRKKLNLENINPVRTKISTPGLPADSLTAYTFSGIFPGGFTGMTLITDISEQVVSILLVDDNPRQRTTEILETDGFHTFNFILNRAKSTAQLVIKHEISREGATAGVIIVNSILIDPNAVDPAATPRPTTRSTSTTAKKTRTGKIIEHSRWFVPKPLATIILRASGTR